MKKFIILALFFVFVLNEEQDDEGDIDTTYTGKNSEKCLNVEVPNEKNLMILI